MDDDQRDSPNATQSDPVELVWQQLLEGDPGPAVAFFDLLMESDFAFAAGGFLRDLAERVVDSSATIEDQETGAQFEAAAREAILTCENGDQTALELLLNEARDP